MSLGGGRQYRARVVNSAKAGACADCEQTYPPCVMDWDHRPGSKKRFDVAKAVTGIKGIGLAEILDEIKKCELVCANCHRLRTNRRALGGHA